MKRTKIANIFFESFKYPPFDFNPKLGFLTSNSAGYFLVCIRKTHVFREQSGFSVSCWKLVHTKRGGQRSKGCWHSSWSWWCWYSTRQCCLGRGGIIVDIYFWLTPYFVTSSLQRGHTPYFRQNLSTRKMKRWTYLSPGQLAQKFKTVWQRQRSKIRHLTAFRSNKNLTSCSSV